MKKGLQNILFGTVAGVTSLVLLEVTLCGFSYFTVNNGLYEMKKNNPNKEFYEIVKSYKDEYDNEKNFLLKPVRYFGAKAANNYEK